MCWNDALDTRLTTLLSGGDAGLDAGAELEVDHPDGKQAFLAALARHHRVEAPTMIWVRPIAGRHEPEPEAPAPSHQVFDLDIARRRNLTFTGARVEGAEIVLDLHNGQRARIRPARAERLVELRRWDSWYYNQLTAHQQLELDALEHDTG